jgi:two-component system response regulator (stage 0 sporulation protein A)
VLLVDDNDDFLDGVVDWVAHDAQIEIVGRAHSGSEALGRIEELRPDMVLMDVMLPDMSGFEVARRIKSRDSAPLVVLLSFHDNHAARLEAWTAGADGFVAKSETTTRLMPLVGDLLRQRRPGHEKQDSILPSKNVPPKDLSK